MNAERVKEIQKETAYPESRSVQQALMKVWNECEQSPERVSVDAIVMVPFLKNYADGVDGHFCIARKHPKGYNEFWNEKHNKWCSEASVFKIGKAP